MLMYSKLILSNFLQPINNEFEIDYEFTYNSSLFFKEKLNLTLQALLQA